MTRLPFFLIWILIPPLLAKCTVKEAELLFKTSVYEFSVNLLTEVAQEKKNHFVISPLSTWISLASMSLGAAETPLEELKQILKLENDTCLNDMYLNIATDITSNNNTDVVLERTSNIYVDDNIEIIETFKNRILKTGVSKFESISFQDVDLSVQIINDHVSGATHETIDEIVSPEDLEDVLMIMIDAINFKGSWQIPFLYEETNVSPFYNRRGVQIGDVNLMSLFSSFNIRSLHNIKSKVLELPYGINKRYSMLLFLPFEGASLNFVLENLKLTNLSTIFKMFEEYGKRKLSVQIPRFKITSDLSTLKQILVDMGLNAMFDSSGDQFPLISHSPLYVSNFIQKADIEVTEGGTSAVKRPKFSFKSSYKEFIANRPFIFMIVDKKIEIPIFTGVYSMPSLF